jgi:hypothetical protein
MNRRVVRDPKTNLITEIIEEPTPEEEAELEAEAEGIIKLIEGWLSSLATQLWATIYRPIAERMAASAYYAGRYQGARDQAKADHAAVKLAAEEGARSAAEQVVKQVAGPFYEQGARAATEKVYPEAVRLGHESVVRRLAAFVAVLADTAPNVTVGDWSKRSPLTPAEEEEFVRRLLGLYESLDEEGRLEFEIAVEDYKVGQLGDLGLLKRLAALEQTLPEPEREKSAYDSAREKDPCHPAYRGTPGPNYR